MVEPEFFFAKNFSQRKWLETKVDIFKGRWDWTLRTCRQRTALRFMIILCSP